MESFKSNPLNLKINSKTYREPLEGCDHVSYFWLKTWQLSSGLNLLLLLKQMRFPACSQHVKWLRGLITGKQGNSRPQQQRWREEIQSAC